MRILTKQFVLIKFSFGSFILCNQFLNILTFYGEYGFKDVILLSAFLIDQIIPIHWGR